MTRSDNQFVTGGLLWSRRWVGDNSGRYEWTAGKLRAWCESRQWIKNEKTGRADGKAVYRAEIGGNMLSESFPTLLNAMRACVLKQATQDGNTNSVGTDVERSAKNRRDDHGHGMRHGAGPGAGRR